MTKFFARRSALLVLSAVGVLAASQVLAQSAPPAGPRVDAIKKAGALRVGVLANPPWLTENTKNPQQPWGGPAWTFAVEVANRMGVKVQPIAVSHETKVPVLATNQVDISITALAETPERLKVVDFISYSNTSVCMFGRATNAKFMAAKSVDDLNKSDLTIAYITGGAEETWVPQRFPAAKTRGAVNTGSPAPIEEIMAGRADAAPINRIQWLSLSKKVRGLAVLPKDNDCQGSTEKAQPVGVAIDKGQDAWLTWLRDVAKQIQAKLTAEELAIATADAGS
jgi:polar amino acid transport system substrate-binding protein